MTIAPADILARRVALGWSVVKLSLAVQVSAALLRRMEAGGRPLSETTLGRIERALDSGHEELIRRGEIPRVGAAILLPATLRAARALIEWTRFRLAHEAKVDIVTIGNYERNIGQPRVATLARLRKTLESAGVIFVEENGEGPGVRLRKAK
jgi:transcriptional regulator with XRE-family HTH domain